jgi:hypothetical protein
MGALATGTGPLLRRLLGGRRYGRFAASRKSSCAVATADLCPVTGRARLCYRRAAEVLEQSTPPTRPCRRVRRGA